MTNNTITEADTIIANLHIVREQTKELEHAIDDLETKLLRARGTGDITAEAEAATKANLQPEPAPVVKVEPRKERGRPRDTVEAALRGHSMNITTLVKNTGLSANKVSEAVKALRADRRIANVGSEDFPLWTARIGDSSTPAELNAEVKRLIMERPMMTQELIECTGARLSRVSGSLIALQRTQSQLLNLGTARRARWFLVSENAKTASLAPKVVTED